MKKNTRLRLAILPTILALAACAQNPATGRNMFSIVGQQQELAMGEQAASAELKRYGLYRPSSVATKYVTNLCQQVFATTEIASQPISCLLIDSDQYNAWATPGYLNVYRGFVPYVNSEAELVSVLGHESGHLSARHIAQGATRSQIAGIALAGLGIYLASKSDNSAAVQAAMAAGSIGAGIGLASYSRADETEADALGRRYMARAGYDPRESVNAIRAMQTYEAYSTQLMLALTGEPQSQDPLGKLTSSHPATPDRLTAALSQAGEPDGTTKLPAGLTPATPSADPQGRNRFLNAIDGLIVGPQRAWGIAGRGYIALPPARIKVALPDGFVTSYSDGAKDPVAGTWLGRHPQSGVSFKLQVAKLQSGLNPSGALSKAGAQNIQRVEIGGREAYTGTATSNGKPARLVAIGSPETERAILIVYTFPTSDVQQQEEGTAMKVLQQSQFYTEDAMRKFQPLQLAIRTFGTGDKVETIAEKLPQGALRQEWFRALNSLEPGQQLKLGQKYKTVVDPNQ